MKTSSKIAALLATFATTFALGCAAPSDDIESSETAETTEAALTREAEGEAERGDVGTSFKGDIAKLVIDKLANAGFDLFLNKVGLGNTTPDQLDRIIQQLEQIERELLETRDQLNTALVRNAIDAKITSTHETMVAINQTLHRYKKVIELTETVEVSRMAGDEEAFARASFALEDAVREFVWMFDVDGVMNRAPGRLHLVIAGSPGGEQNLIDLYRWKLRAEGGRLLTSKHTESLHAGYTYFEDLQALAAFLQAECNAAVRFGAHGTNKWPSVSSRGCSIDQRENDVLAAELERFTQEQRAKLPMPIPEGVVIDQVSNFTGTNGNTHNKPMFMTIDGTYRWAPSDNVNTEGSVPRRLDMSTGGGNPWRMPSDGELAPLFAGARGNLAEHLNRVFATKDRFAGQPFIWTTNTVNQNMEYDRVWRGEYHESFFISVRTQKGYVVDASGSRSIGQPVMLGNPAWKHRSVAEQTRDRNFAEQRGGMIVVRSTHFTDYM